RPALVARIEAVMFGVVPVQPPATPPQNSWTSTFASEPLTAGIKVWPFQPVAVKPVPVLVPSVYDWSRVGTFNSVTLLGLPVRSVLFGTPSWKSLVVVSVMQPLVGAVASEKFFVVVVASLTTTGVLVLEL